jgi:hypothetical protein
MSTDDARAEGFISSEESHSAGRESIRIVVPMVGRMTVTHDEREAYPLQYDTPVRLPVGMAQRAL